MIPFCWLISVDGKKWPVIRSLADTRWESHVECSSFRTSKAQEAKGGFGCEQNGKMPRKTEGLDGLANNKEDLTDLTSKSEIQFQTPRSAFITKKRKLR